MTTVRLDELGVAAPGLAFEQSVLRVLQRATGTEQLAFMAHESRPDAQGPATSLCVHGVDEHAIAEYRAHYAAINPFSDVVRTFRPGTARCSSSVMSLRAYRRHPYYAWSSRHFGAYELGSLIGERAGNHITVTLGQSAAAGDFSRDQVEQFQSLLPVIRDAWFLRQVLEVTSPIDVLDPAALIQVAARDSACLALTKRARLVDCNALGDLALTEASTLKLHQGTVSFADSSAQQWLTHALTSRPTSSVYPQATPAAGPRCTLVRVMRPRAAAHGGIEWLLFVDQSSSMRRRARLAAFRIRHGLTSRESEVLGDLIDGMDPATIAAVRSISIETCRSHIKSAMRKSGCSRQSELIVSVLG